MTAPDDQGAENTVRPLTAREMKVYLWLVRETMDAAEVLAAQLHAMRIIASNENKS